jgi:hypothetical protein
MIKQASSSSTGWAVEVKTSERRFFAGIFYFNSIRSRITEVADFVGLRTMIFRTRKQARDAAKEIRTRPGVTATPVKVRLTVERISE